MSHLTPIALPAATGEEPDVATVAALLGEPSRAAMCLALMDGCALPAGELASRARVSPQTASNHLDKLVRGRVLAVEQQGRWRYYRLRDPDVASAVEALAVIAPPRPATATARHQPTGPLRDARTCYGHFAGRLGVALTDAMLRQTWIESHDREYLVTPRGTERFRQLGIDPARLRRGRRGIAYPCLDCMSDLSDDAPSDLSGRRGAPSRAPGTVPAVEASSRPSKPCDPPA